MLVLTGAELIFFIVAGIVMCFGYVMKTVLITHQCLAIAEQCLHSIKAFLVSHTAPPVSRLGVQKKLGGKHSQNS